MSFEYFKHTIDDIATHTSLTTDFINRAHSKLSGFFRDHRAYGDNNQVRFSDSGLTIWDRIAQLKFDNKNLPEISRALDKDLQNQPPNPFHDSKTGSQTLHKASSNLVGERYSPHSAIDSTFMVEQLYERLLEAKENEVAATNKTLKAVEDKIQMLLPEGTTAEQLQAQLADKQRQEAEIARMQKRNKDVQILLNELQGLDGKWGKRKQRRVILQQLSKLKDETQ